MPGRTTRNRNRRRVLLAGAVAALAAGALPASASASFLLIAGNGDLVHNGGSERNVVSVRQVSDALIVTDTSGLTSHPSTSPSQRCTQVDRQTMRCPTRFISRFETHLAAGDDTAGPMNTHLPVEINGEEDNDTYLAGSPSFLTNVEFVGGTSTDFASYAGSGGTGGGRGVRIANDGLPNDGRVGLDTDNIGRDVEELIGSAFADELTAAGKGGEAKFAPDCCQFLRGGPGADVMRAGSGGFSAAFEMGPVPDGPDKIIGGSRFSIIHYDERTRPVTATLNFGGADDGEAGEGDEIIGGHEQLFGGSAGDILQAPALSTASHLIEGNGGNDLIDGGEGNDILVGNGGGDSIRGLGGNDRLLARDGTLDTVDCGLQTDSVEVDSLDHFGNCENGTIGVLRLAPTVLRVKAGELATLRLSWSHPRAWRQLRRIELQLRDGKRLAGKVAIGPRDGRIRDTGAISVMRGTKLTRRGKTVSARLALRLDRKLAGKRLRLAVKALDTRGRHQLETDAGSVHVRR